jgi:hypothetical protein
MEKGSIMEMGYGIIPKLVMLDKRLTVEAKSIYAYLCSYAGAGNEAFPSIARMIGDLCISENRFYNHMNLLVKYGYIIKHRNFQDNNLKGNNIYELAMYVKQEEPKDDEKDSKNW